jgi:acyl carrier protein
LPNPFATEPGERVYKTGDLARYLADGRIDFVGRLDHQVKVRGLRIELGEIEMALIAHPAIDDAAVIVHEQSALDKRIIAYVVSKKETSALAGELRNFLREKLPDFMLPSQFVMLDRMPLTPSGKIDRPALPAHESLHAETPEDYVAPRDSMEERLVAIWVELLAVDRISIHDNFFELGGHSLLIGQIVARVREAFKVDLKLRTIFDAPTVAELAMVIRQSRGTADARSTTRIQARPRGNKRMAHLLTELDQLLEDQAKPANRGREGFASQEDSE